MKFRRISSAARGALLLIGLSILIGAIAGLLEEHSQGYWKWSTHLFWRLLAHDTQIGAVAGVIWAALWLGQFLMLGLLLRPRRVVVILAGGWFSCGLLLSLAPSLLKNLVERTPAAKLPLFANNPAAMNAFVSKIINGALLPERILDMFLDHTWLFLLPLLIPLLLGLIVYFFVHWPLRRFLNAEDESRVHLRRWLIWAILTVLLGAGPSALAALTRPASIPQPNLVLISIDTLRRDAVGAYGGQSGATPNLDRLAQEGARFATVRAPASWTLPSHAAILTGRWPWRLGVRRVAGALEPSAVTLAELLAARGYDTYSVVTHLFVDAPYGLGQGFDRMDHPLSELAPDAEKYARRWLRDRDPKTPFFLFVHLYDPHWPYQHQMHVPDKFLADISPDDRRKVESYTNAFDVALLLRDGPPELTAAARALYLSEVWAADHAVGQIVAEARKSARPTLISVVSDHGELFGEHRQYGHGLTLFEPEILVPWIVTGPGVPANQVLEETVGLIDVAPTLLALLGFSGAPAEMDGMDVAPVLRGSKMPWPSRWLAGENMFLTNTPARYLAEGHRKWFSGVTAQLKSERVSIPAYYTLVDRDPQEELKLSATPDVRELKAAEEQLFAGASLAAGGVQLSPDEIRRLRELGYLK